MRVVVKNLKILSCDDEGVVVVLVVDNDAPVVVGTAGTKHNINIDIIVVTARYLISDRGHYLYLAVLTI